MKIILPMAGIGQRFVNAGFTDLKPLIKIDEKPIIERICEMFPADNEFIFICNREHQTTTPVEAVLKRIKPEGKIIWIDSHKKGPVYSCLASFAHVDDDEEVFVNYCDLLNGWDFNDLVAKAREGGYAGVLPSFKDFHPASLGDTYYAYMKVNDRNELLEIREKASFTNNRIEEFASAGGYYFSKGRYYKKYFQRIIDEDLSTSGEYYASLPYNLMVGDGLKVLVYEVEKHIVLGTPADYYAYVFWSDYFRNKVYPKNGQTLINSCTTLIPIAGKRDRMFFEKYELPKPLIPVMKKPMFINSIKSLPKTDELVLVSLEEYTKQYNLSYTLKKEYPSAKVISLKKHTDGMACTCLQAKDFFAEDKPLLISNCDYYLDYNDVELKKLLDDETIDVIMFAQKDQRYERRDLFVHTYLKTDETGKYITLVSEKAPISHTPINDDAFAGILFFRTGGLFIEAVNDMIKNQRRIKGQFYVATSVNELIAKGKKIAIFHLDKFISWSKDVNLKEFEYWENYFSEMADHPYKKEEEVVI